MLEPPILILSHVVNTVLTTAVTALVTRGLVRRRAQQQARAEAAAGLPRTIQDLQEMLQETQNKLENAERLNQTLSAEVRANEGRLADLRQVHEDYERLRKRMAKTPRTRSFFQPVLLVGPKNVGKTSLIQQWHAPWDYSQVEGTMAQRVCEVPFTFLEGPEKTGDLDTPVQVRTYLGLRLHDFPGEIGYQQAVIAKVREEAIKLRRNSHKNLGVIVVCMFDAEQARVGIRPETNEYYNGELFRELRRLVAQAEARLEKLILVYNKADLLRRHFPPDVSDSDLLAACRSGFAPTCSPLRGVVNSERIREMLTVLARDGTGYKSEGAGMLKGEVEGPLVAAFRAPPSRGQDPVVTPATLNL